MKKKKKGLLRRLSGFDDIKNNFIFTKNIITQKSKKEKKHQIKETFEEALRRHSIKKENEEKHLTKKYLFQKITFFSYIISSIITSASITFQLYQEHSLGLIYYSLYFLSLALFIKCIESAFRCYQIRIRKLGGLKNFLKSPKQWYPKKYIYKGEK